MLVALDSEGRLRPGPLTCRESNDLISCLHAIGAALAIQGLPEGPLNLLIDAIDGRSPLLSAVAVSELLNVLDTMDEKAYLEEVRDLHGSESLERHRTMKARVVRGLREAVRGREAWVLEYVGD